METNTGPLGHGFPVAVGHAIAAKLQGSAARTFVVMGDGEMQEGSNWEAAMTAATTACPTSPRSSTATGCSRALHRGHQDWSRSRTSGRFGFEVRDIPGHDYAALLQAFEPSTTGKPVAVIANTIKGKGVSFMENRVEWHHKVPSDEQVDTSRRGVDR